MIVTGENDEAVYVTCDYHCFCPVGDESFEGIVGRTAVRVDKSDITVGTPVTGEFLIGLLDFHVSCCVVTGTTNTSCDCSLTDFMLSTDPVSESHSE